ncbi:MAG TPA: copper resistance CopC family protein [Methylomirabilota bacterium]|nr:copper resistance CopC family protein [Methylomirabilota bacterium]
MRRAPGAVAAILAGAALLLAAWPAGPAGAHAIVLQSDPPHDAVLPRAPDRIVLRFNSKLEKRLARVALAAADGTPVPLPAAAAGADREGPERLVIPLPPLRPGTYLLRYRVLAADGHITESVLRFTVRDGS